MKKRSKQTPRSPLQNGIMLGAILLFPVASHAQAAKAIIIPVEMSMTAYLIIFFLLVLSIIMFFLYQRRFNLTAKELADVVNELSITRHRLTETGKQLDHEKHEHQETTDRYTNILFDAETGMFQMDLSGKCTYINTALQAMSGLYPKKALKEGLESAIHPEDRTVFMDAWDNFTKKGDDTFELTFRFLLEKGREIHVECKANKVRDQKNEIESYIGWVTNVTPFHEKVLEHQAETARFQHFVSETIEGFYRLIPESPISLESKPEQLSESILNQMTVGDCNDTFAAMYGSATGEVLGKTIGELKDGCGPFKSTESVLDFIKTGYQSIDIESIRQDPSGNRMNLINNVVGIVEDNHLIEIWGTQRNISKQKREKAELSSKVKFMNRILNSLPADLHVKDTRCRYLYASKKLADRTGIPQEEWIGKTIFEVIPATPREHDQPSIEAMKSGSLKRFEQPYEVNEKKGWMENHQIPLVSDEGLVEGVVSLSLEITERKNAEKEALRKQTELETKLVNSQNALANNKREHSKTSSSLSKTKQNLITIEAEKREQEYKFQNELAEQKRTEDRLRRNEQGLLARQQQLEEQLTKRLEELQLETDKRAKWEELLEIKEDNLRQLEENLAQITEHYSQETVRREQAETNLEHAQSALNKTHSKVNELTENRERELKKLNADHTAAFEKEQSDRKKAEKYLARTKEFLESTQDQVKRMTEDHAVELEKEVAERKTTAEKLIQNMEELDELRLNFSQRIEEETKSIKQELAKKQIRETALRQHGKDLENRIKELEKTLQIKSKEFAEQLQAREGAEVEKNQIEQKMQQLTKRQQDLVDRETQKLHLGIAEIRLQEVKLRKRAYDLEQENEQLSEKLRVQTNFLEKAKHEQKKAEAELEEAQAKLKQFTGDQSKLITRETAQLQQKLERIKKIDNELKVRIEDLQDEKKAMQNTLEGRSEELSKAAYEYHKVVDAYKAAQKELENISQGQDDLIARTTGQLKSELKKFQRSEQILKNKEVELAQRIKNQQNEIGKLNSTLTEETDRRYEAEKKLRELEVSLQINKENADIQLQKETAILKTKLEQFKKNESVLTSEIKLAEATVKQRDETLAQLKQEREATAAQLKQIESRMANLKEEHQADLRKSMAEMKEVGSTNNRLVEELNEVVQNTLKPVIQTAQLLEVAENLSKDQRKQLSSANYDCRTLIDSMNYRAELTQLNSGNDKLMEGEINLHQLIKDLDQKFSPRAETNKLFFATSFAQYQAANNVPKQIVADENKLSKILSILLSYALNKTTKGRLGLHTSRETSEADKTIHIAFELTYTPTEREDKLLSGIFDSKEEGIVDLKYGLTLARRYIQLLGGNTQLELREAGVTALTVHFIFKRAGSEIVV